MQEEVGTVIETWGTMARVLVKRNLACDYCPSRSWCASLGGDLKRVDVSNVIGAKEGQLVKIGIPPKAVLRASFILYMVPILALIIGAMLGDNLGPRHNEIWSIPMGVGFFVGSYLVIKALSKCFESKAETGRWSQRFWRTKFHDIIESFKEDCTWKNGSSF